MSRVAFDPVGFVQALTEATTSAHRGNGMYLTPEQLAERWKGAIQKGTLANWRNKDKGPPFVKMGTKVLYPIDKLEAWEREQLRNLGANDNNDIGGKNVANS